METQTNDVAVPDQTSEASSTVTNLPYCEVKHCGPQFSENLKETPETAATAANARVAPPLPEQMTLRQFRALRGKYFTIRHKRMEPCGHRLDQVTEPRNNCEYCWFAFFQTHGELVQTADKAAMEQGIDFLDRMRGVKWRKMFLRFMSTVAMFKKEMEDAKAKENDGQAGQNQSSERVGQGARQNLQDQGNLSAYGKESGPVAANIPDPIAVV